MGERLCSCANGVDWEYCYVRKQGYINLQSNKNKEPDL